MKFVSKFAGVARPRRDVFNYIFEARRPYPSDRILYTEHETGATLTLGQLERKSRQLATALIDTYGVAPGDVIAILASDSVGAPYAIPGDP
jgi:acyl-coenzyme A synthetase/AMP-(fatty) acid ligase